MWRNATMLNNNAKYINNRLALRPPQRESLEIFQQICEMLSLSKTPNLNEELIRIQELFPTLSSFERTFPSVCFALATGIGKTRLMGALIAYLNYEKGVKNFFVMAPNLTIYKKLKEDLGNPTNPKYVFRGLDRFIYSPRIIDGDNYEEFRNLRTQTTLFDPEIMINIFNISKLNSESGRMRRLNEVLGQSYFDYMKDLPDLCVFMDESHHYRADRGFETINDLKPVLGIELTATPQIQNGSKKIDFKNVVYEYSLAHALKDGLYVKVPAVFTRKDFRPEEYTPEQLDKEKLNDGIRIHEETKSRLDIYARTFEKPMVKPFVLVVAKDTEHSKQIKEYLTSNSFLSGYYRDKVLEINSTQRGSEKDENIDLLLSLEKPENKIEIVIHVNMLKEGWDVTNLYTIIPLRASASETLTEQTIGRGLRLPYGQRTGVDEVDRLSIVSHDRYESIINLANDPNSLVRKFYFIDPNDQQLNATKETMEMPTAYDQITMDGSFTRQLALSLSETATEYYKETKNEEQNLKVAECVTRVASGAIRELGKHVKSFGAIKDDQTFNFVHSHIVNEVIRQLPNIGLTTEDLDKTVNQALEFCVQTLTDKIIPIPEAVIQPFTEVKNGFYRFKLDTTNINWHPSGDTIIGTELQEGGHTFDFNTEIVISQKIDTVDNEIARHIIVHDNVDYNASADLIYSLINDARCHFLSYLDHDDTEKVMRDRQNSLANIIYAQMNEHFYKEELSYNASEIRPFKRIEAGFGGKLVSDDIYDLRATLSPSEVKNKIFKGFKKTCHTLYKFDSETERRFAIVLENDSNVILWMRPSSKQFNIYYGPGGIRRYEPDFVVETSDNIYMVETKAANEMESQIVKEKAEAAVKYCIEATKWNSENGGKPWRYVLIPHDEVRINSTFNHLLHNSKNHNQSSLNL